MQLTSPAFKAKEAIPVRYTCQGEDVNPPLVFSAVPAAAKSLALIMDDPDAATDPKGPGKSFDHWVVYNLPPNVGGIDEGRLPPGATLGVNSSDQAAYIGPCPPTGSHRYKFKLFALSGQLDLAPGATKAAVLRAIKGKVVAKAELIGTYEKQS